MLTNYTNEKLFDFFEDRFLNQIYNLYPHIIPIHFKCYTSDQYVNLDTAVPIEDIDNDGFAYAIGHEDKPDSPITASIMYSPELCKKIGLSKLEQLACIAHEFGHIVHYFNENLNGVNNLIVEIKADSITKQLGLSSHLKSALNKLKSSGLYSDFQCKMLTIRQTLLD